MLRPRSAPRSVLAGWWRAAPFPLAALAVHQLRYALAFGGGAGAELARQGHAYLHSLAPWLIAALALGVGGLLVALGRALTGQRSPSRFAGSLAGLWLACTLALVAIYAAQELLEGALACGHPVGLAGVFGYGGLWALPAAACLGLVLAAFLHGARWALAVASVLSRRRPSSPRRTARSPRPLAVSLPRAAPVAAGWSGRGPPA